MCFQRCVEKLPKRWNLARFACLGAFMAGLWAVLVSERLDMETPIVVLCTLSRAGVSIMTLNGKSRFTGILQVYSTTFGSYIGIDIQEN